MGMNGLSLVQGLVILLIISESGQKHYHSIAGPYSIYMKRIERCPGRFPTDMYNNSFDFVMKENVRTHRHQSVAYSGQLILPAAISHEAGGSISLASWDPVSGWRENAHKFSTNDLCVVGEQYFKSNWFAFLRSVIDETTPCPYLAGLYNFRNFQINADDLPVKHFFYGKWRADLIGFHNTGQFLKTPLAVGCIRIYADTVPK